METLAVPALVISLGLSVFGFLAHRAVAGLDKALERIDAKLDAFAAKQGEHASKLIELEVRCRHLEAENGTLRQHITDLGEFLRDSGFRKREG